MSGWTEGYVSGIEYTHGFYRELTPSLLSFSLLLKAVKPPSLAPSFRYCELGCGHGFSINLMAAAYPEGEFWATDFNPAHILSAKRLCESAGSTNVHFSDHSFAEFLDAETPEFDVISLHGVYSWVSEENRATIVEFIRRKLKPGGLVYISYNCSVGWASTMPLRELVFRHAAASSEPVSVRVEKAMDFAKQVVDLNSGYFLKNQNIAGYLERMQRMPRNYIAHEHLNASLAPKYFDEVARELDAAKLSFVTSANLADHVDVVNMNAEAQKFLKTISDPLFRETVRDYLVDQQFRKDIFAKGVERLTAQEQNERLLALRFALVAPRASVPMKVIFPIGEIELQPNIYVPLLDVLARGPATIAELLRADSLQTLNLALVTQALALLTAMEQVAPCLPAEGERQRAEATARFNTAVMERALVKEELSSLASPVTGSGVALNRFEQLFLLAHSRGTDPAASVWTVLESQGQKVVKEGRTLETAEENLAELWTLAEAFASQKLPVLRQLGIA